ncbi:hypothetical protein BHE74_00032632 [Ensete ventricosum]|nr:hypothetical protein BHE74_00032632 [Ensete ventricosum]
MQRSHISGYFHDFTKERTMMLEVFLDDDLQSTAHDRKKEQEKGIHTTPITMMPSISVLALPKRGNVFIIRADISRVEIGTILMQDGEQHEEVKMGPEKSPLLPILNSDQAHTIKFYSRAALIPKEGTTTITRLWGSHWGPNLETRSMHQIKITIDPPGIPPQMKV